MKFPKPVWIAATLATLTGVSGFVWLPVPFGVVARALAAPAPGFALAGGARVRWASGDVHARDLRLSWHDRVLAEAATVRLRLDLRPWSAGFGTPSRVIADGAVVAVDAESLAALQSLGREPAAAASIQVELNDGRLAWTQPDGERLEARIVHARAILRTGAAREAESAGEAEVVLVAPTQVEARLRFRAVAGRAAELSVSGHASRADELARFVPALDGLHGAIGVGFHLHAGDGFRRVSVHADAAQLRHPALPETFDAIGGTVEGDLDGILRWSAHATTARGRLAADGSAVRRAGSAPDAFGAYELDAQARLDDCTLDDALSARLAEEAPQALAILDALGLRGVARARAGFRGTVGAAGLDEGWNLAVAAPVAGLGVNYAGFPDESGETFGFPYPLSVTAGTAAWSGRTVLVTAQAAGAEAGGDPHGPASTPMRVGARCAVELDATGARTWLDLDARAVRLGDRLGVALQANPETGALWYRLGAPHGEADADVALRPAPDGSTAWSVRLDGRALQAHPPDVGLTLQLPRVEAWVDPGGVRFTAELRTATAQARAEGAVRPIADRAGVNEFSCTVSGDGYLDAEEREMLATARALPVEFVQIEPGGALGWSAAARALVDGSASPPLAVLAAATLRDAAPSWPQKQASGTGWTVRAAAAATSATTLVTVEPAAGSWKDARLQLGGFAWRTTDGAEPALRGLLTASLFESPIQQDEVQGALLLLHADQWATGLRFAGKVAGTIEMPLEDPSALRARLDLAPLHVVLQPGALGATVMREPARYMLTGVLRMVDGTVTTQRLGLRGNEFDLVLEEASGVLDEAGLEFRGVAVSARGMRLRPQLEIVGTPEVLASLDRIGIDGRIVPKRVEVELTWPAGGTPHARASGTFELADFDVAGPPPMRRGAGTVTCESFVWNGPADFRGNFRLENGTAQVAGVQLRGARASVALQPERVTVTDFEATALDGRIFTSIPAADGTTREGQFSLGLTGNAGVRADFAFEGFLLERMGEELGYRGPLAGRLDGRVDLRSPDPSPVNYRGTLNLHITDGILGAVPVLSQLWNVLGISTPVFREGRLALQFLSEGRVLVEELVLLHPLLEVTGERVITMDSYLGLKVTVRTLGFFGRLPLVRDLMDLIVEQDVYGPASAPRLRQRGLGKIFQGDPERVPFPLWVPRTPPPDRTRSPLLPPERVLTPRP
jgi:hypothetical protein